MQKYDKFQSGAASGNALLHHPRGRHVSKWPKVRGLVELSTLQHRRSERQHRRPDDDDFMVPVPPASDETCALLTRHQLRTIQLLVLLNIVFSSRSRAPPPDSRPFGNEPLA